MKNLAVVMFSALAFDLTALHACLIIVLLTIINPNKSTFLGWCHVSLIMNASWITFASWHDEFQNQLIAPDVHVTLSINEYA